MMRNSLGVMSPRQRFSTAKDLHRQPVRRPQRDDAATDDPSTASDDVTADAADRTASADEVRAAGERAAARWASLLQRLAE